MSKSQADEKLEQQASEIRRLVDALAKAESSNRRLAKVVAKQSEEIEALREELATTVERLPDVAMIGEVQYLVIDDGREVEP